MHWKFNVDRVVLKKYVKYEVFKIIKKALVNDDGIFSPQLEFLLSYEAGDWQEVSRLMVLQDIEMHVVYDAYVEALKWYGDMFIE